MESKEKRKERAAKIHSILEEEYPDARVMLDYENPYQLLVATILAAQCTDERVNRVTPDLFEKYPDADALAGADKTELEELIRSTGFYRNKAKSLLKTANDVAEKHGGEIPSTMAELTDLSGVGRKTANVVLANCFDKPAIVVDTHLKRVAQRLELTDNSNADKIEKDVAELVPEERRTRFSYVVNFHGRNVCTSRKPKCPDCKIEHLCPYPDKTQGQ